MVTSLGNFLKVKLKIMKYYSNLTRYDSSGRRVAVFARQDENNPSILEIFVLRCSKKDQFTKKLARDIYELSQYELFKDKDIIEFGTSIYHPEKNRVVIFNPATPKKEFLQWCNKKYFKLRTDYYRASGTVVSINQDPYRHKMGRKGNFLEIKTLYK